MSEIKYSRSEISKAIHTELDENDYLGEKKDRYYEIIGIVMAALDKIDEENNK
jgi:hypothetical protein